MVLSTGQGVPENMPPMLFVSNANIRQDNTTEIWYGNYLFLLKYGTTYNNNNTDFTYSFNSCSNVRQGNITEIRYYS